MTGVAEARARKVAGKKSAEELVLPAGSPAPPPTGVPLPFTISDIRAAIPPHCFQRSALKSGFYLLRDLLVFSTIFICMRYISTSGSIPPALLSFAWIAYWILAGMTLTGVWVVAHECGHQAFSDSKALNDTVGWVLHSALLVPYHSWRITHGQHHGATNSMEDDSVFVPSTRSDGPSPGPQSLLAFIGSVSGFLVFGWPLYLTVNATGPAKHRGHRNDHFTPSSHLFAPPQAWEIVVSTIGVLAVIGAIIGACWQWGPLTVFAYYGIPLLIVNANLVLITLLQHADVHVPHFRGEAFSWLAGAICTVDRTYGLGYDVLAHHITDSHVAHHIFSTMPWYHAVEATPYIKKALGAYYLRDETPVPLALWRAFKHCRFVEDAGDIVFYKAS